MLSRKNIAIILILTLIYFIVNYKHQSQANEKYHIMNILKQYTEMNYFTYDKINSKAITPIRQHSTKCTMKTCFNLTKCNSNLFKIYVYSEPSIISSNIYDSIIRVLSNSKYKTNDPYEACLFVSSIDTLDRDKLSKNYIRNLKKLIPKLKYWNQTVSNHIIFNLYSGSWPNYTDSLEFNSSNAILIKASFSVKNYRKNFDVSFPLFHSELPFNDSFDSSSQFKLLNNKKKYLLTFKGKVRKKIKNKNKISII